MKSDRSRRRRLPDDETSNAGRAKAGQTRRRRSVSTGAAVPLKTWHSPNVKEIPSKDQITSFASQAITFFHSFDST